MTAQAVGPSAAVTPVVAHHEEPSPHTNVVSRTHRQAPNTDPEVKAFLEEHFRCPDCPADVEVAYQIEANLAHEPGCPRLRGVT